MLCIAGKNNIACNVLEYALTQLNRNEIVGIINNTDDGQDNWQRSFQRCLKQNKVEIVTLEELYMVEQLIFLSLEYNKIVKSQLFLSEKLYNIHFSYLPFYRGMYTSAWPILMNEKYSGVTLHQIDHGIDTGNIVDQIAFPITKSDTAKDLYLKYIKYGTSLAISNLSNLISGNISVIPQDKWEGSYYSKKSINYKCLKIDLNQTAINIYNQIRAFTFKDYQLPVIYDKTIISCEILENRSTGKAGSIVAESEGTFILATIDYDILLNYR